MRHDPFDGLDQTGINGVADGLDRGGILGLSQDKMSLVREKKEEIEKVLIWKGCEFWPSKISRDPLGISFFIPVDLYSVDLGCDHCHGSSK